MKKPSAWTYIKILALVQLSVLTLAAFADSSYITRVDGSRIRSEPDTDDDSVVLGLLEVGTPVKVLEKKGRWLKIKHDGQIGWVNANLLRPAKAKSPAPLQKKVAEKTVTPPPSAPAASVPVPPRRPSAPHKVASADQDAETTIPLPPRRPQKKVAEAKPSPDVVKKPKAKSAQTFTCPSNYTAKTADSLKLLDSVAGINADVLDKPFYIKTIAPAVKDVVVPGSATLTLEVRSGVLMVHSHAQISAMGGFIKKSWDSESAVQICMRSDNTLQARTLTSAGSGNAGAKSTTYTIKVQVRGTEMHLSDDQSGPQHIDSEASLVSSAAK